MMNREELFYDKLKSEYEEFLEELEEYDAEDFMENAEYIAAIKEIYEYLERDKPVKTDEQLGYFLKLRNPLNFMCEQYLSDRAPIYDSFNQSLWRMEQEMKLDYKTNVASEELKKILRAEYESDGIHYAAKLKLYAAENLIKGILKDDFCFDEYDAKILMQFKKPFAVLLDNYTDSRIADFAEQFDGIIEKLNGIDLFTSPYTMQKDKILPETKYRHDIINYIVDHIPEPDFESTGKWVDFFRDLQMNAMEDTELENNPYSEFQSALETIECTYGTAILQGVYDMAKSDHLILENELVGAADSFNEGKTEEEIAKMCENGELQNFSVYGEENAGIDMC